MTTNNCKTENTSKGRTPEDLEKLTADINFQNWQYRFQQNVEGSQFEGEKIQLKEIRVTDVDMFGSKFGFGKFQVVTEPSIPGIVFHRSPSVCCLFTIRCEEQRYALLTVQPRVPAGYRYFPELVAGMTDAETHQPRLVAAKEIREETGLEVNPSKLVDLGEASGFSSGHLADYVCHSGDASARDWLRDGDCVFSHNGWFNSAGGSSEATKFYLYETEMDRKGLQQLIRKTERQTHGVREEGESIRLIVVALEDLLEVSPSIATGHAMALLQRYEGLHTHGLRLTRMVNFLSVAWVMTVVVLCVAILYK